MPGGGIKGGDIKQPSGFYRGFLNAWDAVWENQREREIDVLVGMAARAVFPDPDHRSFKTEFAFATPVSNDKRPSIIFRLEARDKRSRMTACRTKHPFDTTSVPKPF